MELAVRRLWTLMAIYQFNSSYLHILVLFPHLGKKRRDRSWDHMHKMHLFLQFIGDLGNLNYLALQTMFALCRMLEVCECVGVRKGYMCIVACVV